MFDTTLPFPVFSDRRKAWLIIGAAAVGNLCFLAVATVIVATIAQWAFAQ